jgi:hypothetical protein
LRALVESERQLGIEESSTILGNGLKRDLILLAHVLTEAGQPKDAELFLREALAIHEQTEPDDWTTFHVMSLLGASLLIQKNYADAERLLLAGYAGIKEREANIPADGKARVTESLERLVQLYDGWEKSDQAAEWRKKLKEAKGD